MNKPLPAERKTVKLGSKIIDAYVGEYELNPRFFITFLRDGEKFMTQGTGQPAFEVFAESETRFFPKAFEAEVEFVKDAAGKATGLILTQGGGRCPRKRSNKRLLELFPFPEECGLISLHPLD